MNKEFGPLVGRVLSGIAVSKDGETTLRLTGADGTAHYVVTEGDCCSESWWADVLGAASAYGGTVTDVRTLGLTDPGDDGRTRQEEDEVYGYAIDTTKGTVTLAFRNSSNGYYGGWAMGLAECPIADWQEITTNDWRA